MLISTIQGPVNHSWLNTSSMWRRIKDNEKIAIYSLTDLFLPLSLPSSFCHQRTPSNHDFVRLCETGPTMSTWYHTWETCSFCILTQNSTHTQTALLITFLKASFFHKVYYIPLTTFTQFFVITGFTSVHLQPRKLAISNRLRSIYKCGNLKYKRDCKWKIYAI